MFSPSTVYLFPYFQLLIVYFAFLGISISVIGFCYLFIYSNQKIFSFKNTVHLSLNKITTHEWDLCHHAHHVLAHYFSARKQISVSISNAPRNGPLEEYVIMYTQNDLTTRRSLPATGSFI